MDESRNQILQYVKLRAPGRQFGGKNRVGAPQANRFLDTRP